MRFEYYHIDPGYRSESVNASQISHSFFRSVFVIRNSVCKWKRKFIKGDNWQSASHNLMLPNTCDITAYDNKSRSLNISIFFFCEGLLVNVFIHKSWQNLQVQKVNRVSQLEKT